MSDPDAALASLTASIRELRRQLRVERKALGSLAPRLARLDTQLRQVKSAGDVDPEVGQQLDRLAAVLDPARITVHVASAIRSAEIVESPVPHLVIAGLWPADVHAAAYETVPAATYFSDPSGGRCVLSVPPSLAPLPTVVTWRLLTDLTMSVVVPELAARFQAVLDRRVSASGGSADGARHAIGSQGRLVMRLPGYRRGRPARPTSGVLKVVTYLGDDGVGSAGGSLVHDSSGSPPRAIPFVSNTCLAVFVGDGGAHEYDDVPEAGDAVRITHELSIGSGAPGDADNRR